MLGAREVRRLLAAHGLDPDRRLGQNFVTDPGTVSRMVALSGAGPDSRVLEIGPGVGSLTLALADSGASVLAVEKDPDLVPILKEVMRSRDAAPAVAVVQADAMDLDWEPFLAAHAGVPGSTWQVVANLPYNVAVPIITGLLECAPSVSALHVMVQMEVAERICALPGGRSIGVPTVRVGWFADASIVMTVSPEVFTPRPRVRSAVVELSRRPPPVADVDPAMVFDLVGAAYRQRRKMLRSSIGSFVPTDAFEAAGVEPTCRPEELSTLQWGRLASVMQREPSGGSTSGA